MSDGLDAASILRTPLPPRVPHRQRGRAQRLAAWLLERAGWKVTGQFPDMPRLVVIAAPHSSGWDGIWGMLVVIAIGVDITILGKRELFVWPMSSLLRWIGVVPVDRFATHGIVGDMTARFAQNAPLWLGIAPEGTRKRMPKWRTGFWHVARAADVPILPIGFHYPDKIIHVGPLFETSEDVDADIKRLRDFYAPFQGKNRGIN
ncbi:MAG: 1-acyl-sn-glycerol-3-phosphate acyltransferase [Dokdonella sp.]